MNERLNAVMAKYHEYFGKSPDVISFEDGRIIAFSALDKTTQVVEEIVEEKIIILEPKELRAYCTLRR